ncbi:hypothetical protein Q3G72_017798 [Acer saccharum]|nr:hypothetical protein Q3G72_017798 [Acer saccharum]
MFLGGMIGKVKDGPSVKDCRSKESVIDMRDKESLKLGVWLRADSPKSRVQTRVGPGGVASKKDRSKAVGAVRAVECGGCEDCWREGGRGLNFEKLFIIHVSDQSMVNAATDVSGVAALIGNNGVVVRKKNKFLLEDDSTMLLDATTGEDELVDCKLVVQRPLGVFSTAVGGDEILILALVDVCLGSDG